jgi:Bifunctional DNA primase/polymerase, N-terminal
VVSGAVPIQAAASFSVYDQWAPLLRTLGLCPLPIIPNKKMPGEYIGCGRYRLLSDWTTRPPLTGPQPSAGIGLRLGEGLVGVDIDTDDGALKARLMSTFIPPGWETISRIGGRGELFFLRVHSGRRIESKSFRCGGGAVVEVLAAGKQCVLPPTIHPNGKPYRWGANGWTFYNTDLETLPEWPE